MTTSAVPPARTRHRHLDVDGVDVFYRESVPDRPDAPVLLLLHGFPSASHQYRRLIDVLGSRFRLIAPDYPGFGHTSAPMGFEYSFDQLAATMAGLVTALRLPRFALYMFDFGAPVGFRLGQQMPDQITGLVIQNGNAYDEGISDDAREFIALSPQTPGSEQTIRAMLTLDGTRRQYETGTTDPELIPPESWLLDQHFLDLPGRAEAQVALAYDYKNNLVAYPAWQQWLREHQPPALILWGTGDPFFTEAGARAYLRDLPHAQLHLLHTGHFALEDHVGDVAALIADFLDELPDANR